VTVFAAGEEADLVAHLRRRPGTIIVTRGKDVEGVRELLGPDHELVPAGGWAVVAGRVQRRLPSDFVLCTPDF
jgi:hypothetical protein